MCSSSAASRSPRPFERELADWGAVIIKFWVQIDKDTQLARFNERQNTPAKQWKITEEDWRNVPVQTMREVVSAMTY